MPSSDQPARRRPRAAGAWMLFSLLLAAAAPKAWAEATEPQPDETEVVVTAARRKQPKQTVSAAVTVVTAAEIAASGAATAAEALRGAAGLDVRVQGPLGSLATPSLRGAGSGQVLVLVDGRRANNPQTGLTDLTDLPVENIERIEIVRGGASALYGSDAIGGVINIITRAPRGSETGLRLAQSYGSLDTRLLSGQYAGGAGRMRYTFSGQHVSSANSFRYFDPVAARELDRDHADYDSWDATGKLVWDLAGRQRLTFSAEYGDGDKKLPGSLSYPTPQARQQDRRTLLDAQYERPLGDQGDLTARLYRTALRNTYQDAAAFPAPIDELHWAYTDVAELLGHARPMAGHALTYGYEFRDERVRSTTIGRRSQETHGLYLQDQWGRGRAQVIPGARLDLADGFSGELSPKLGMVYRLSNAWTARGNVGRSFRMPGLNDRFWPEDSFSRGNPNLRPERAVTADLGAAWAPGAALEADVTAFVQRISDLNVWQPGVLAPGKWSPVNVGKAQIAGVEAAASWKASERLDVQTNLTYQDARDRSGAATTDGKLLLLRPQWLANAGVTYRLKRASAGLELRYTGRRASDAANDHFLDGALVTDLRLQMPVGARVKATLQLSNLFDARYELQPGYPVPGREISLRLLEEW